MDNQTVVQGGGQCRQKDGHMFFICEWGLSLRGLMAPSLSIFHKTFTKLGVEEQSRLFSRSLDVFSVKSNLVWNLHYSTNIRPRSTNNLILDISILVNQNKLPYKTSWKCLNQQCIIIAILSHGDTIHLRMSIRHSFPSYFLMPRHLNLDGDLRWMQRLLKSTLPSESMPFICFSCFSSSSAFSFVSLSTFIISPLYIEKTWHALEWVSIMEYGTNWDICP